MSVSPAFRLQLAEDWNAPKGGAGHRYRVCCLSGVFHLAQVSCARSRGEQPDKGDNFCSFLLGERK